MSFYRQFSVLLSSKLVKDFATIFIFDILAKFFSLITLLLTIRLLSISEYAAWTKVNSLAYLLFASLGFGISIAFVRNVSEMVSVGRFSRVKKLYLLSHGFVLLMLLPAFFGFHFFAKIYQLSSGLIILALFYTLIISYLKFNQSFFQGQEKYFVSGLLDLIRSTAVFFPLLAVSFFCDSISILSLGLIYVISGFVIWLIFFRKIFLFSKMRWNWKIFLYSNFFIKESTWLIFYYFLSAFMGQIDIMLLSQLSTNDELANYGVAQKYQVMALSLLPSLLTLFRVKTAKQAFVVSPEKRRDITSKWIRSTFPLVIVIIVAAIFLSKYILPLLNGSRYDAAIPLFQIMLIGVGFSYIFAPNVQVFIAAKRFPTLCLLAFISLLISVTGNYLLIPHWGAIATATLWVVSNTFLNIGVTVFVLWNKSSQQRDIDDHAS